MIQKSEIKAQMTYLSSVVRRLSSNESGAALLITSVIVLAVTTVIMLTVLNVAMGESNMSAADRDSRNALSVAEAGVNEAMMRVTRNRRTNGCISTTSSPLNIGVGQAIIKVMLTDNSGAADVAVMQSQGTVGQVTRQVTATVKITDLDNTIIKADDTTDPIKIEEEDLTSLGCT